MPIYELTENVEKLRAAGIDLSAGETIELEEADAERHPELEYVGPAEGEEEPAEDEEAESEEVEE